MDGGDKKISDILDRAEWIGVPVIVIGELYAGFVRTGRPIPVNDIWIAATCARAGATLLTWDAHFRLIPRCGSLVFESSPGAGSARPV